MTHNEGHCHEEGCSSHDAGCCHSEHHHHEHFSHELIEMADEAWMEVLYEKIKEKIRATNGQHLEQLASIVAEANQARWRHKLAKQTDIQDFEQKVTDFFKQ